MLQFIDTHIHLQDFKPDCTPQVLDNTALKKMVSVSAQYTDFQKIAALMQQHPGRIYGAFGIHPWYWREPLPAQELRARLEEFPRALVGEIGVDELKEKVSAGQHKLFSEQLAIAKEYKRPVIIHAAKAFKALMIHEEELKSIRYVYHGFTKNEELLQFIIRTGGYIGLSALFLKQKQAAKMWQMMPKNRILFETDAPYRIDEADYGEIVQQNLQRLSEIAQIDDENLAELLIRNAEEFLNF